MEEKTKPPDNAADESEELSTERRRIGRIVHDERGDAFVEWHDAPPDFERPKLEIEDSDDTVRRLAILNEGAGDPFNPYNRPAEPRRAPPPPAKRDLRKLSEWIKLMRGMERKPDDGEDETG